MAYRSLRQALDDLERTGRLRRIDVPLSPDLEIPLVHRRVFEAGGPALLFERVEGSDMPVCSNLFGTLERARYLLRHGLERMQRAVTMRADPAQVLRTPWRFADAAVWGRTALPMEVAGGPVLAETTSVAALPRIRCWPEDGGPFVTLPQVYSEDPEAPGPLHANVGMYRIQLAGNAYGPGEAGLHYQIHRGIGVHHAKALARGEDLRVSVFVGGPPAHTLAAVLPLPEGLSELVMAGMLAGRRFRYTRRNGFLVSTEADVCMVGRVRPGRLAPEGPFGDHLGYYSLRHPFPVLEVETVYRRRDAVWPFTVVGRPPQEDTIFGKLIHEITGPMVPASLPGVRALHAVDEAGVHPLLLAVGSERYVPYGEPKPRELLTQAHAILGFGQASLAKVLVIAAAGDAPPPVDEVPAFLGHVLERFDPRRDLHFHTRTTMDTLDYSGTALNEGSKLVWVACGPTRRTLGRARPVLPDPPPGWGPWEVAAPGILVVSGPPFADPRASARDRAEVVAWLAQGDLMTRDAGAFPLVVLVDDAEFAARTFANFLWVTFTRCDPARDVDGVGGRIADDRHWECDGPVVFDARRKPHHAPPLEDDPEVVRRVEALAARGGPLAGLF
ncbi:MAG: UbiD family decarboxylase [Deltaproteobacteria bacterium]|nr:MAG: UbiD family decarboxylase [Deltaproteobacteria bacterium]